MVQPGVHSTIFNSNGSFVRKKQRTYSLNSGVALYLSNSFSHSDLVRGGKTPAMGRHSVMLSPDSVRRVTPPTTMTANTSAADATSHPPTTGGERTGSSPAGISAAFEEKKRGSNARRGALPPARRARFLLGLHRPFFRNALRVDHAGVLLRASEGSDVGLGGIWWRSREDP